MQVFPQLVQSTNLSNQKIQLSGIYGFFVFNDASFCPELRTRTYIVSRNGQELEPLLTAARDSRYPSLEFGHNKETAIFAVSLQIAIVPVESPDYRRFVEGAYGNVKLLAAMRNKRR